MFHFLWDFNTSLGDSSHLPGEYPNLLKLTHTNNRYRYGLPWKHIGIWLWQYNVCVILVYIYRVSQKKHIKKQITTNLFLIQIFIYILNIKKNLTLSLISLSLGKALLFKIWSFKFVLYRDIMKHKTCPVIQNKL